MTANQRRSGFRLPWSAEEHETDPVAPDAEAPPAEPATAGPSSEEAAAASPSGEDATTEPAAPVDTPPVEPTVASAEPPQEFMRDLVTAMRRVADEAKQTGMTEAKTRADERLRQLEAEAERRRQDLGTRAEADIAAVGEWARAEAERIKTEAERRVASRRSQLDEELAADRARAEADAGAVTRRIEEYERELASYHAQLSEISDPAAFAAAAKRMPNAPTFESGSTEASAPAANDPGAEPAPPSPVGPMSTNGVQPVTAEVHPAEEEVLSARLAELDASLPAEPAADASAAAESGEPSTTEVVVSGLGSFGAITSFRQALSNVDGIQSVALSLGQSGEFIFRASHRPGFDMGAAIAALEGDAASVQPRSEGGLLVKLERRR